MATGWAHEGAVLDQIEDTITDGVLTARARRQRVFALDVLVGNLDLHVFRFGHDDHGGGAGLETPARLGDGDALDAVAEETGKTVPQVALNWLLGRPTVANIVVGARNEAQLRANLGALGWSLTADQVARLDSASRRQPVYPYWHQMDFDERNPKPTRW